MVSLFGVMPSEVQLTIKSASAASHASGLQAARRRLAYTQARGPILSAAAPLATACVG